ncbi:MAG: transcriptional repressor [Dehalococcoidales bacterium]|jgi:Fe2+ or Zn2+ uptake regulation protein|nr:transcriptional repressor [Dehalococcoidales bacterium]
MHRKSKQKEAIFKVMKETTSHPTAEWVYERVRREIPNISLGTVYRDLESLKQEGEILKLGLAGTRSRFDGKTENHYHFRCLKCGRLFDINGPADKKIDERLAQKTGFTVFEHRLEFHGLCKSCQS